MGEARDTLSKVDDRGFLIDLQDLKKSYNATLRMLTARRREIEEYIEHDSGMTMEELENKQNRSTYKHWRLANDGHWNELHDIREMISEVNFVIEWLRTGRQPGTKRGIDRRSVYQNTVLLDPMIMANFSNAYNSRSGSTITEAERHRLEEVLGILSPQEKECYVLSYGQCYSHSDIAKALAISKGAVDKYVQRAHAKVSAGWQGTLF
ncbi:sigma factor-like helix-turn-helix DNA-binding protein [Paenibacillus sinopodophylli]|uniref:sigma factor-like helix-turn-helix DNA-binding protein n=1 Tax=Paenibacillus sinopodophylli TaxID=1837342 RepID=UPI00110D0015|nr:sigma factor-like helix-turn-helix DNA-binding protein [Paenibacillus sinopodophylli]